MSSDLVSVIVPVYKVEQYLNRCISSIIKQSFTNLEIILVDDGSPDMCPKLCDEWALQDPRIKVVHKDNGGLSDARNAGLKKASGNYICFVDSDDYVSTEFVETLYKLICLYNTDMSAVSFQEVFSIEWENAARSRRGSTAFEGEDALRELFSNDTYANYAWNKMYKRELFDNIKFPVGRKMEDLGTTYRLLMKAKKIAFSKEQLYYYFQREDSILHSVDLIFYKDKFELSLNRYREIDQEYPGMVENNGFLLGVIFETYPLLHDVIKDFNWKETAQTCYNISKEALSIKDRVKFLLVKYCGKFYCIVMKKKIMMNNRRPFKGTQD